MRMLCPVASIALLMLVVARGASIRRRNPSDLSVVPIAAPPPLQPTGLQHFTSHSTTPVVTDSVQRPTPLQMLSPVVEDVEFPRTKVHVMEKCCPYSSYYAVGEYPSVLEEAHGWLPALTFHAFEFNASLANCWRIVNATDKDPHAIPRSHLWEQLPPGSHTADAAHAFCLPPLPHLALTFFYVSAHDGRASFVSEPLMNVSQRFFDEFALPGWNATAAPPSLTAKPTPAPTTGAAKRPSPRAVFQLIHPLAYYYWRPRLPTNVIADVRIQVSKSRATVQCPTGYEKARGNLNHNFALDPYVAFCVKHAPKPVLNPLLSVPREYTEGKYLTGITIKPRNTELVIRRRNNETVDLVDCLPPWQLVPTTLDTWDQRGVAERQLNLLRKLNRTFEAFNLTSEYSVFTGFGEWLSFCTLKDNLYLPGAELRGLSAFVQELFVDQTQIARKNRLTTVHNAESPHPMKVVPQGRLKYVNAQVL